MRDVTELRRRFADGGRWFHDSPLYQVLSQAVAGDDDLIALAAHAREGQQPTNLLMAATHAIVLDDPGQRFARFFPSVAGPDAAPPEGAAAEYPAFCAEHRATLVESLQTRLVQTNEPARATFIRLALHEVARRTDGPVTFLEVGPSAGVQLRFDRWGVETGGRRFGPRDAPLTIHAEWRGEDPPPDLDDTVAIRDRLGLDLHPVDATDPDERRWLTALVWPEHIDRFATLSAALDVVAADPPEIRRGDAIDDLAELDATRLATDVPLVVWHSQVRIHVPDERRPAFDAAITALGDRRRLFHVAFEHRGGDGPAVLSLADSAGPDAELARGHGHGRWVAPA